MSPTEFGWEADIANKNLSTRSLPDAIALERYYNAKIFDAPANSGVTRKAGNCSCLINQLTCTVFCACEGKRLCCNPYTEHTDDGDDDDLHMFDDTYADFMFNWALPIVENTVHGLISYQASWYYEVYKGYWWSNVS